MPPSLHSVGLGGLTVVTEAKTSGGARLVRFLGTRAVQMAHPEQCTAAANMRCGEKVGGGELVAGRVWWENKEWVVVGGWEVKEVKE